MISSTSPLVYNRTRGSDVCWFVCLLIYVLLFRAAQLNPILGTSFERDLPNLVALYDKHEAYFSPGGYICDDEKGALKHSLTAWLYLPLTIFQIR